MAGARGEQHVQGQGYHDDPRRYRQGGRHHWPKPCGRTLPARWSPRARSPQRSCPAEAARSKPSRQSASRRVCPGQTRRRAPSHAKREIALGLPLPDTSWMSDPWPRERFTGWMGWSRPWSGTFPGKVGLVHGVLVFEPAIRRRRKPGRPRQTRAKRLSQEGNDSSDTLLGLCGEASKIRNA
jgi:hypothetical protein